MTTGEYPTEVVLQARRFVAETRARIHSEQKEPAELTIGILREAASDSVDWVEELCDVIEQCCPPPGGNGS